MFATFYEFIRYMKCDTPANAAMFQHVSCEVGGVANLDLLLTVLRGFHRFVTLLSNEKYKDKVQATAIPKSEKHLRALHNKMTWIRSVL